MEVAISMTTRLNPMTRYHQPDRQRDSPNTAAEQAPEPQRKKRRLRYPEISPVVSDRELARMSTIPEELEASRQSTHSTPT